MRVAAEAEWSVRALEMEGDTASATLKAIISATPPSPRFAAYHETYIRRLYRAVHVAPPGSMERHLRRVAVVQQSKVAMRGKSPDEAQVSGCCTAYPYEISLHLVEIESEVTGAPAAAVQALSSSCIYSPASPGVCTPSDAVAPIADGLATHLAHSFPWLPAAGVNLALALRRRRARGGPPTRGASAAGSSPKARSSPTGAAAAAQAQEEETDLNTAAASVQRAALPARGVEWLPPAACPSDSTERAVIHELSRGLMGKGYNSAAGFLALAHGLLLQGGAAAAAASLEASKAGLKYVAQRDLLGKERMTQVRRRLSAFPLPLLPHPSTQPSSHTQARTHTPYTCGL